AGFSSLISMMELTSRNLIDLGLKRKTAIVCVAVVSYLLGIPSARNLVLFGNQDFVWGVALMISGIFVAVAVMRYGVTVLREKEVLQNKNDWDLGAWWDKNIKFIVPILGIALLVWWLSLSATVYAPDDWYNPMSPYSVMTCLVQWGAVLAMLLWLNRWMAERIQSHTD
ncbi:MAG: sodium-dependent transporter, partial [Candidatus Marinimicrobia bacterium]|nr:sodium-dependent transporter [Candidatus Neomarinimicrobiota bacterium]